MLPYCYLPSLFLNIPQSCLVMSDDIRHFQPLFPQPYFALLLLKLLYLRLYISNHLEPSQATKKRTTDFIWVEKHFKKSFWHAQNFKNKMVSGNPLPHSTCYRFLITVLGDSMFWQVVGNFNVALLHSFIDERWQIFAFITFWKFWQHSWQCLNIISRVMLTFGTYPCLYYVV